MNEKEKFVENKINRLYGEYSIVKDNMIIFKEELETYAYKTYTKALLTEIQDKVDRFLKENNLDINLHVSEYKSSIIIFGYTLTDQIVWETFQIY